MASSIETKGLFRVSRLDNVLRLVDGKSNLTKEEAASVFRYSCDKIQLYGENGWESVGPEAIGLKSFAERVAEVEKVVEKTEQ